MTNEVVFIDTSGFYSLLVSNDDYHQTAKNFLKISQKKGIKAITTDYILDETITLLTARKVSQQIPKLLDVVENSSFLEVCWTDQELFFEACKFILRNQDRDYSFTDCISFQVMKKLKINKALTKDQHFKQAGFLMI